MNLRDLLYLAETRADRAESDLADLEKRFARLATGRRELHVALRKEREKWARVRLLLLATGLEELREEIRRLENESKKS